MDKLLSKPTMLSNVTMIDWEGMPAVMRDTFIRHHMHDEDWKHDVHLDTFITLMYALLLLVGIPSNIMTVIIIMCSNGGAKSPTNYFLLNLTIVDTFSLVCSKY